MKKYNLIQLVTLAFFIGVISGILIYHKWNYLPWKEILLAIPTLLAAFVGAWFAFKLEDRRRKEEQEKKNISACCKANFVLSEQLKMLDKFQKEKIKSIKDKSKIWLDMEPSADMDHETLKFNIDDLQFILDTTRKDILSKLFSQDELFHKTISMINMRSRLLLEKLPPEFIPDMKIHKDQGKLEDGKIESLDVGIRENISRLKDLTNKIIQHVDEAIESTKNFRKIFIEAVRDIYPEVNLTSFEQIE